MATQDCDYAWPMTPSIPIIPSRPLRGPSKTGGPGGFLMGTWKPFPPGTLPERFVFVIDDSAMEPMLSQGDRAVFSTIESPVAGDCIVVGTIFGPEIRLYEPLSDGEWAACALNPEYEDIRTTEERAWVIAVMVDLA